MVIAEKYRIQKNCNKFKSPDILTIIIVCRPEWFGIIVRTEVTRRVQQLLEGKPGEERKTR
jgi:hypothetical protein